MSKIRFVIIFAYICSLVLLIAILIIGKYYNIPFYQITADPAYIHGFNPLTGILSNLGIMLWCVGLTCCYFTSALIWVTNRHRARFLLFSGFMSTILVIDDFFMFHDHILFYSRHFINDFPVQEVVYSVYGIITLVLAFKFFDIFIKTNYLFFVASIGFLGLSVMMDLILPNEGLEYFFEDSFKFLGIVSWTIYFSLTSFQFITSQFKIS